MKRWMMALTGVMMCGATLFAQSETMASAAVAEEVSVRPLFGVMHYDSLLQAMPEYVDAMQNYARLKENYEAEVNYNEEEFKRQFANFLAGQKSFTKVIMLKRQSDLQNAMERHLEFRAKTDSMLAEAKRKMMAPIHLKLKRAVEMTGMQRHYMFVANLDGNTMPFVNVNMGEDATPYVVENLNKLIIRQRQNP